MATLVFAGEDHMSQLSANEWEHAQSMTTRRKTGRGRNDVYG